MNPLIFVGVSFSIFVAIINVVILIAIKFNDLKHFSEDLKEIKNKIDTNDKRLDLLSERVATIEGKLN